MKKMKLVLLSFLILTIAIGGSGCMSSFDIFEDESQNQAEMAEKLLYEKYGEEFVVESLGGRWGTATDGYYTCNCYPKSDESLKFQATVDKDYDYIADEYATKRAEINAANYIYENCLKSIDDNARVFVYSGNQTIDSNNSNLTIEEFLDNNSIYYYAYIIVDKGSNVDAILKNISHTPFYESEVEMDLTIFLIDDDQKERFNEWNKTYKKLDDEFFSLFENAEKKFYAIKNSEIKLENME